MTIDKRARFTLRLPEALLDLIGKEAMKKGVSLNALILQILWDWVEQQTS